MKKQKFPLYLLGAVCLVFIDQLTKAWAVEHLKNAASRPLIPGLIHLTYVENRGAAFGILQDMRVMFVVLGMAVIAGIIWLVYRENVQHWAGLSGLAFIIAGTIGNLIDRAFNGFVVDMFEFEFIRFAIFNVADVALTCGGVLTCLFIVFVPHTKPPEKTSKSHESTTTK